MLGLSLDKNLIVAFIQKQIDLTLLRLRVSYSEEQLIFNLFLMRV
ncbi:hypothetical protein EV11_1076 [Prochlorococcus sp. SS52]|nr:hypothetical protein EV04_0039 [Prochlorococcus marinus str. LG]KGG22548.1 hypothetical protein EV08_0063 [Prochlorococcus marinus str. SS2]KGG24391.1 hypothetical protein EV09_0298 [Prochlorococcus marinus str. SS35]KGG34163.1 hypothetical protein EV10_0009 [Prochlorococcus marinus str. SS51]KGG35802.1 hypothetical protein EV11_1076 [Prochlorococcus sp. SS52]